MSGAATVVSAWSPFIVYIAKRSLKTSHLKESERQGLILRPVHQVSCSQVMPVAPCGSTRKQHSASLEHSSSQD